MALCKMRGTFTLSLSYSQEEISSHITDRLETLILSKPRSTGPKLYPFLSTCNLRTLSTGT